MGRVETSPARPNGITEALVPRKYRMSRAPRGKEKQTSGLREQMVGITSRTWEPQGRQVRIPTYYHFEAADRVFEARRLP